MIRRSTMREALCADVRAHLLVKRLYMSVTVVDCCAAHFLHGGFTADDRQTLNENLPRAWFDVSRGNWPAGELVWDPRRPI